jgi:hypothetical protein
VYDAAHQVGELKGALCYKRNKRYVCKRGGPTCSERSERKAATPPLRTIRTRFQNRDESHPSIREGVQSF